MSPTSPAREAKRRLSDQIFQLLFAALNAVIAGLLVASLALIQCLIGGTRLVFSLPAYGLIAVAAVLCGLRAHKAHPAPSFHCVAVSAVFFAYILARAAASPWDHWWWDDFYMVIACLMLYGLTALFLHEPKWRGIIVAALLALALAEFLIGMRQFARGDNWMPFGLIRPDSGRRASGMFISSIHFAGFLEAVGVCALSYAVWSKWAGWARVLAGFVALNSYIGVAVSGSRGGYGSSLAALGAFALLSVMAVKRVRPARFRPVLLTVFGGGIAGLAASIALMWQIPLIHDRLVLLGTMTDVRIYNWQAALDQFRVAPVVGTGAGTHTYYGRLFRRPEIQSDPIHAHSDYLELLAEYGIIGAAGMAVFLVVHLRHGFRRFFQILDTELDDLAPYQPARSDSLALIIGTLSAMAAYLVHSAVDFNLHIPGNALTFAFIFAILASPQAGPAIERAARWTVPCRLAIAALGVWMAVAGLSKLPGEYWCERARVALRDRRFELSIQFAERALSYQRRNPDLYFHLGEANRSLGLSTAGRAEKRRCFEASVEAYRQSLAIMPLDEHVLVRFAQSLDELGRFAEAREAYETAIRHDPQLGVLHAYFARHLARVGRADEAHERLSEARRLSSANLQNIVGDAFVDEAAGPGSSQ